jgi:glycosyltransferase involved in cell wall biosynthesis
MAPMFDERGKILIVSLHHGGGCFHYSNGIITRITAEKEIYLSAYMTEKHEIEEYKTLKGYGYPLYVQYLSLFLFLVKIFFYGRFTKRYKALLLMGPSAWDSYIAKVFKWTGKPVFYVVHDGKMHMGEKNKFAQKRLLSAMRNSRYLIFLSEYVRKVVREQFGIDKPSLIAPHGLIDYGDIPDKAKIKKDKPNLLLLGRLLEYKGINVLLAAIEEIPDIFGKIIIAGLSPKRIRGRPKHPKVKIIDKWLSPEEIVELLNDSDIMLFPYVEATQSGVATLAINYLIPSIVSHIGGLKDQFPAGGALFIPSSSVKELGDAILELSTNDDLYNQLSREIGETRKAYSWDNIAQSVQDFITTPPL